jgi:hypothetical protein
MPLEYYKKVLSGNIHVAHRMVTECAQGVLKAKLSNTVHACTHMHTHVHTHIPVHTHTSTHTHKTCVRTHNHSHTHTHAPLYRRLLERIHMVLIFVGWRACVTAQ